MPMSWTKNQLFVFICLWFHILWTYSHLESLNLKDLINVCYKDNENQCKRYLITNFAKHELQQIQRYIVLGKWDYIISFENSDSNLETNIMYLGFHRQNKKYFIDPSIRFKENQLIPTTRLTKYQGNKNLITIQYLISSSISVQEFYKKNIYKKNLLPNLKVMLWVMMRIKELYPSKIIILKSIDWVNDQVPDHQYQDPNIQINMQYEPLIEIPSSNPVFKYRLFGILFWKSLIFNSLTAPTSSDLLMKLNVYEESICPNASVPSIRYPLTIPEYNQLSLLMEEQAKQLVANIHISSEGIHRKYIEDKSRILFIPSIRIDLGPEKYKGYHLFPVLLSGLKLENNAKEKLSQIEACELIPSNISISTYQQVTPPKEKIRTNEDNDYPINPNSLASTLLDSWAWIYFRIIIFIIPFFVFLEGGTS